MPPVLKSEMGHWFATTFLQSPSGEDIKGVINLLWGFTQVTKDLGIKINPPNIIGAWKGSKLIAI